jgi:hypothetical protein
VTFKLSRHSSPTAVERSSEWNWPNNTFGGRVNIN